MFTFTVWCIISTYLFQGSVAQAVAPSPNATAACQQISQGSAETQIWPLGLANLDYLDAKNHYWSATNADLTPACAVFPTTAAELSYVVKTLLKYPDVPFAAKSGGHNTNVGFSSVNWGVLISFSKLASTTVSLDQKSAVVGTGARWAEVMTALDPYNLAVVGGRIGDVGVGGLLLGGGLSFLSAQFGLACDHVLNYEVVLANGVIANANSTSNTDLFWALKGGGNQFAIVTRFTLRTFPVGTIWGGIRNYDATKGSAILNATQHFIEKNEDRKAAVIVTGELAVESLVQVWTIFFFYNGTAPAPGVFDEFNAIIPLLDQVKPQRYAAFLLSNNQINVNSLRYEYRAATVPNLPGTNGTDLYNAIHKNWVATITTFNTLLPGFIFSIAYQPMPALIASSSNAAGSNALSLNPRDGDRLWFDLGVSWLTVAGDKIADVAIATLTSEIPAYSKRRYPGVKNTRFAGGNLAYAEYNPLYSNDAQFDQRPYQTYGAASYARLKAIQKNVDPLGFFPKRTGGFKYT